MVSVMLNAKEIPEPTPTSTATATATATATETKLNAESPKNAYHIGGIQVEFPYQPYGSQFAFMGRVISTLDRARKEGHCHALLESPTGTGKSLSLLCSTLAWQQTYNKRVILHQDPSQSKPDPKAFTDPLGHGGGFVPDEVPATPSVPASHDSNRSESVGNDRNKWKKRVPTIFYASRTHSQITQVIREYRKTAYRVPMAVLASRKHYCTNRSVCGRENIDEECKKLLKDPQIGCPQFKSACKVKGHPSLRKGGCNEVHDVEDLVKIGIAVKGCSYYAARSMADDAQLIFCPYSYVINPVIRGAMDVDIRGAILILDEAHNIEDIARDAGSVDIEEDALHKLQMELEMLCSVEVSVFQPLYEMTQDLISWINRRKDQLEKRDFQHYVSCWNGDSAARELQEANISLQCFPALLECATKAIKGASESESDEQHLSGMSVITLEGLFSSLTYFFSRNGCHMSDYQLALRRYIKRGAGTVFGDWTHTLSLWCLNPAVVFRDIANLSLSIILTSGTLSPMTSFSSELGVQFGNCLEAPHVIDLDSQVWPAIIAAGPGDYPLNASYKTADGFAFQDALGKSLEEIFKVIPSGCLVFFPSYKLMDKLCSRWSETGQWSLLNSEKSLFVEPRGEAKEDFELVLKDYYESVRHGQCPASGKKRRIKKTNPNQSKGIVSIENNKKRGAALFAVCRGKVSEGIDFSDDYARGVIIIGIPFPNVNDIQVGLKKKYNDTHRTSNNLLSGSEWYCHQAFRALNQAAGRCIRHRFDHGAIVLLDNRFREERNQVLISKWLRKPLRVFNNFDLALQGMKTFFGGVKVLLEKSAVEGTKNHCPKIGKSILEDDNRGFSANALQKDEKERTVILHNASLSLLNSRFEVKSKTFLLKNCEIHNYESCIDGDCCMPKKLKISSSSEPLCSLTSNEESVIVKETPSLDGGTNPASPGYLSKDENSCSTFLEASSAFPEQASSHSISLTNGSKTSSEATPQKNEITRSSSIVEVESVLNSSVNSNVRKKRTSSVSDVTDSTLEGMFDVAGTSSSYVARTIAAKDAAIRRIEFDREAGSPEQNCKLTASQLDMSICFPSQTFTVPVTEKRLEIYCSFCQSPLSHRKAHLYAICSLTVLSKAHLRSLSHEKFKHKPVDTSETTCVLITDTVTIDQQIFNCSRYASGQEVWCKEDGCVFKSIFCPFCTTTNCIGVQVVATDASNVKLLNKVLLLFDHLKTKELEELKETAAEDVDHVSIYGTGKKQTIVSDSIEKFAYKPPRQSSTGWRTIKTKQLRLPKRGPVSKEGN